MEEGLETSSMSSVLNHGLDLNKDPFEERDPSLTLTLTMEDSVTGKDLDLNESMGVECENDAPNGIVDVPSVKVISEVLEEQKVKLPEENQGEGIVVKRRGRKKKVKHDEGVECETDAPNGVILDVIDEVLEEQTVKLPEENQGEGVVVKRRGRKKKVKHEEGAAIENGTAVQIEHNITVAGNADAVKVKRKRGRPKKEVKDSRKDGASGDDELVVSSPGRQIEQGSHDLVGVESGKMTNIMEDSIDVSTQPKVDDKPGKRRRGRKRKKVEASECHNEDATADEQDDAGGKINLCKRGRGRKRKNAEGVECLHDYQGKKQKGNTMLSMGLCKRVLRSGTVAIIDGKKHIFGVKDAGLSCQKTEIKIKPSDQKILEGCNDDHARPNDRRKKLKGRRGRPPKKQGEDGISRLTDKRLGSAPYHVKKSKLKGAKTKVKKLGRREEQQGIRDQIKDILLKAGWTIEFRPRNGREYNDAVYVDTEKRTYWSCTLAYYTLKEQIEAGEADDKARSAFTPIPEEVIRTLFRVRKVFKNKKKKKQKDVGNKKSKKMTKKKLSKKQPAKNSSGEGSVPKTVRRKKLGPNAEDRKRRKPALLARGSRVGGDSDGDEFILYEGKRTLLAWMIDLGVIQSNAKVHYCNGGRKRVKHEGNITGDGILCSCCEETLSLADFESHAGSKLSLPFQNIILESGQSLLQCLVDSWNKEKEVDRAGFHSVDIVGDDPNDDTCNICGDGGDLICCDSCPSTFHQSCLDIQKLPSGDWRCVYCSCKFCGTVVNKSSTNDVQDGMLVPELLTCHLCEGKFHLPCVHGDGALDFESKDLSFCGIGCQKIFEGLKALLGVRHKMEEGFCWTLLRYRDFARDINLTDDLVEVESNCKLAVANSIMNECFVPIIDQRSKINVIQSVVYSCGSNFRRLNYNGFYTVILEKGDELISAASIRVHGNQVVEMPFIGTRYMYRRQGMCRRLLTAIETALGSLGIEKLVIPAVLELIETWTNVFGFTPLEKIKRREMKYMSMMVFPGTDMLQKPLLKDQFSDGHVTSTGSNADALSEDKLNQDDKGANGLLNDTPDCSKCPPCQASEPDTCQTETIDNCSSEQPGSGTVPSDVIDEQHQNKMYQHCVSKIEDKKLFGSPVEPISTIHDEKAIQCLELSKEDGGCLLKREVGNHDSDSLEVPAEKDSIASSGVTCDLMCASTGSVKATSETSHQIEKAVELPVPNGSICDTISTSDLSSFNSPLANHETSRDDMRSNINDHKEVSVGVHVLSLDSKSLKDGAQLESCSS